MDAARGLEMKERLSLGLGVRGRSEIAELRDEIWMGEKRREIGS